MKRQLDEVHDELSSAKAFLMEKNRRFQAMAKEQIGLLSFEHDIGLKMQSELKQLLDSTEARMQLMQETQPSLAIDAHTMESAGTQTVDEAQCGCNGLNEANRPQSPNGQWESLGGTDLANDLLETAMKKELFELQEENASLLQIQSDYKRLQMAHEDNMRHVQLLSDSLAEKQWQLDELDQLRDENVALKMGQEDCNLIEAENQRLKALYDETMDQLLKHKLASLESKMEFDMIDRKYDPSDAINAEWNQKITQLKEDTKKRSDQLVQKHNEAMRKLQQENQQLQTKLQNQEKHNQGVQKSLQEKNERIKHTLNEMLTESKQTIDELQAEVDAVHAKYATGTKALKTFLEQENKLLKGIEHALEENDAWLTRAQLLNGRNVIQEPKDVASIIINDPEGLQNAFKTMAQRNEDIKQWKEETRSKINQLLEENEAQVKYRDELERAQAEYEQKLADATDQIAKLVADNERLLKFRQDFHTLQAQSKESHAESRQLQEELQRVKIETNKKLNEAKAEAKKQIDRLQAENKTLSKIRDDYERLKGSDEEPTSTSKQLECHVCGKAFTQLAKMKEHLRRHNGQKWFECLKCNKRFRTSDNLAVHTKDVHG